MRVPKKVIFLFLFAVLLLSGCKSRDEVFHAVLFYSPYCGHCALVRSDVIEPMQKEYGDQFELIEIDTSTEEGSQLFNTALDYYSVAPERRGVPMMIIDETVLVGSREIPDKLPPLVSRALAAKGQDWPDFPLLQEYMDTLQE